MAVDSTSTAVATVGPTQDIAFTPIDIGAAGPNGETSGKALAVSIQGGALASDPLAVSLNNAQIGSRAATYRVFSPGYAAYATPTDIFGIIGSATKLVIPVGMIVLARSTTGTLLPMDFVRRSTLNAEGTPTALTKLKDDTTDPTPTASVVSYGAAPSALGTSLGVYSTHELATTALTAAPAAFTFASTIGIPGAINFQKPVILRGVNDGLYVNLRGAALPAGFAAYLVVQWIEIDA